MKAKFRAAEPHSSPFRVETLSFLPAPLRNIFSPPAALLCPPFSRETQEIGERSEEMALAAPLLRLFFFVVLLLVAVKSTEIARSEAAKLPENEVAALKAVATKLGKRNWNFSVDPCSGSGGWTDSSKNKVTCDCSYANRTVCHIVSIQLSEQNLTGVLPDELSKLTHLSILYLAYNYINGTIPTSWSSLPLVTLVLSGNRLSGQIPKELGNITTLEGLGYLAPEYATRGHLTDKADVFSFGVVALEIITGRSNAHAMPKEDFAFLLDWAFFLQEKGSLLELVDPRLGSDLSEVEALRMLNISLLCTSPSPSLRPTMSCVVDMLEGRIPAKAPTLSSTLSKASLSSAWRFSNPYLSSISKASEFSAGLHSSGYGTYAGSSDSSANKMDTGGSCSITEKNL